MCFQVPTGEYRLSALAPESASGLLFVPSHIDVVVKSPLLNVKFSQVNKYVDIGLLIKYHDIYLDLQTLLICIQRSSIVFWHHTRFDLASLL